MSSKYNSYSENTTIILPKYTIDPSCTNVIIVTPDARGTLIVTPVGGRANTFLATRYADYLKNLSSCSLREHTEEMIPDLVLSLSSEAMSHSSNYSRRDDFIQDSIINLMSPKNNSSHPICSQNSSSNHCNSCKSFQKDNFMPESILKQPRDINTLFFEEFRPPRTSSKSEETTKLAFREAKDGNCSENCQDLSFKELSSFKNSTGNMNNNSTFNANSVNKNNNVSKRDRSKSNLSLRRSDKSDKDTTIVMSSGQLDESLEKTQVYRKETVFNKPLEKQPKLVRKFFSSMAIFPSVDSSDSEDCCEAASRRRAERTMVSRMERSTYLEPPVWGEKSNSHKCDYRCGRSENCVSCGNDKEDSGLSHYKK